MKLREILDQCCVSMKNLCPEIMIRSRISIDRPRTQKSVDSPRVSLKHKYFDVNNEYKIFNLNLQAKENWLSEYPDGRQLNE